MDITSSISISVDVYTGCLFTYGITVIAKYIFGKYSLRKFSHILTMEVTLQIG